MRTILTHLFIVFSVSVISYTAKLLLTGSLFLFLHQTIEGWLGLLIKIPSFLLIWIPVVKIIANVMKYDKNKIGELYYFNILPSLVFHIIIFS